MSIKKIFKKLNYSSYKKGDIYIMLFFAMYPLIFHLYMIAPEGKNVIIFGYKFTSGGFSSFDVFVWVFITKILSLVTFIILIIRLNEFWRISLFIPFSMFFFQTLEIFNRKVEVIDELNFFLLLPFILVSIYLINKYKKHLNHLREIKKFKHNQELLDLKNKALNAQMNPHFITNLTMSLQNTLTNNDIIKTRESLLKFNRLTNLILRSTKSNLISLEEELNICNLYLDLQRYRFDNFKYSLDIHGIEKEELEYIKVPPMIIQPLVENAFKHGILGKEGKGFIQINIEVKDEIIKCSITDNGKGIDHSNSIDKFSEQHSGISIPNIKERLSIFGKVMDVKLDKLLYMENKKDNDGNIIGCETNVNIPILSI